MRAFVCSVACDLHTKASNAAVYARVTLRPRILRDVDTIDTTTYLLGHKLHLPLFTSPTAIDDLIHSEGEQAIGRAVKAVGIAQCISMSTSYPLKDIAEEIRCPLISPPYDVPIFLRFYVNKNRTHTRRLLQEAQERGVSALVLTVDATHTGKREADERIRITSDCITSLGSGITAANDAKGGGLGRPMLV